MRWPRRQNNTSPPSLEDTLRETAQAEYAKDSKLETGAKASILGQLDEIANDEVDDVRALKARRMWGDPTARPAYMNGSTQQRGGVTVADNISYVYNDHMKFTPGWFWKVLAVGGLSGCGLAGGMLLQQWLNPSIKPEDLDYQVRFFDPDSGEPVKVDYRTLPSPPKETP